MRACSLLLLAILLVPAPAYCARPNFVFVLIDDMGYGDLACYGNTRVHTKNVDRLAAEGIRFTQFYVNSPICSPSRTALLTGQFPARWRITSYLASRKENEERHLANWLDPSAPSLARELQRAGYATGHFGKWHMGGQRDVGEAPLITDYGFDRSLTQFEGLGDRILPLLDSFDGKPVKQYALGSDKLGRGNVTWMDRSKITSAFVARAIEFMKQSQRDGKPFYVNIWPDDVHSPFYPPAALRGDGSKRQLYEGVVQATDDQLGPLFDAIRDDPNLREDTLVILASDNGPEPGAGSAGPFRGHKGNLYEGGVREPLIVGGPGLLERSARGTVNEKSVIAGIDLFPSLLSLAQIKPAREIKFDGEDLSAALVGREQKLRTRPLFWVRPPDRPGPKDDPWPDLAMRDGDWKLLINADGSSAQLYDLAKDPRESKNLANDQPQLVNRMSEKLLAWNKTLPLR
jgi:uncharacterized sulfatase